MARGGFTGRIGSIVMAIIAVASLSPGDAKDFCMWLLHAPVDYALQTVFIVLAVLVAFAVFERSLRRFAGLMRPKDWEPLIDGWLKDAKYKRTDDPDSAVFWRIISNDPWQREIRFYVQKDDPLALHISFGINFSAKEYGDIGQDRDILEQLDLEVARSGLLFEGLKAPTTLGVVVARVPLDGLTEWHFWEATHRIRTMIEVAGIILEKARRARGLS